MLLLYCCTTSVSSAFMVVLCHWQQKVFIFVWLILTKLSFFVTYFHRSLQYQISRKAIHRELNLHKRTADGWMDGWTEMMKLIAGFCEYVNTPKNICMKWDYEQVCIVKLCFQSLAACLNWKILKFWRAFIFRVMQSKRGSFHLNFHQL